MYKGELDFLCETVAEVEYRMHILRLMKDSVTENALDTYNSCVEYLEILTPALQALYDLERRCLDETRIQ